VPAGIVAGLGVTQGLRDVNGSCDRGCDCNLRYGVDFGSGELAFRGLFLDSRVFNAIGVWLPREVGTITLQLVVKSVQGLLVLLPFQSSLLLARARSWHRKLATLGGTVGVPAAGKGTIETEVLADTTKGVVNRGRWL
jgi:hypothetical protein